MLPIAMSLLGYLRAFLLPRHRLAVEIATLRQQLAVFKRKQPRPQMRKLDGLFWIVLRRCWPSWFDALILVKPETVVSRHRTGFQWFWRRRSHPGHVGRPAIDSEIRLLIRRMKTENPTWGAPRIRGELRHIGFTISEPAVSRYLLRLKRHCHPGRAKRWLTFLNNHREVIAAFDFFTLSDLVHDLLLTKSDPDGSNCFRAPQGELPFNLIV